IYISCNPAPLARDLSRLESLTNGFTIDSIKAYDMYPGTTHLEVMAILNRS
ncbi:MAG: RNA methyltransferase, partial [Deltaproteobacteria bacterium]|nr:RNA methyltransferase [Deltaproteobacteria bacterium]